HGLPDAEGIADGEHNVADLKAVGIAELEEGQLRAAILDAQDREIAALVLEHNLRLELALVVERDFDLVRAFDDVDVRDDQAGRIDDDAGAERALHLRRPAGQTAAAEELAEDRIVEQRIAVLHDLGGIDV